MGKNDPLDPGSRAAKMGEALARGGAPNWEFADVLEYNVATHTATVRTHTGRPLQGVPQLRQGSGGCALLAPGTTVAVSWDLGMPVIVGCLALPGKNDGIATPVTVTGVSVGGDYDPTQATEGVNNHKSPSAPVDLSAGDWVQTGSGGNHVGVLEGGVTSMGAPTALLRSLGLEGILQSISRTSQTFNDFGQWRVVNDRGRTSFILRAGANRTTQSGPDEEHWTIRLDVGATGDLFNFEVTEPTGQRLFRFHVSADGKLEIYGSAGVDISSGPRKGGMAQHDVDGNRATAISGTEVLTVEGGRTTRVAQGDTLTVATDKTSAVGGSEMRFVNNALTESVGGKKTDVLAEGAETRVLNKSWVVDIGNPAKGARPGSTAGFELRTTKGNVDVSAGSRLNLHADSVATVSGSVVHVNGQQHPLPKFDEFQRELAQFLATLVNVLNVGATTAFPYSVVSPGLIALPAALPSLQNFISKVAAGAPFQSTKARNG